MENIKLKGEYQIDEITYTKGSDWGYSKTVHMLTMGRGVEKSVLRYVPVMLQFVIIDLICNTCPNL